MTTPIQPAVVPPPAAQPAAANPQQSSEWQQFYDWFAYGIVPGSGSTPPAATQQPAAPTTTTPPAASPVSGPLFEASVTGTGPYDSHTTYNCTQFAPATLVSLIRAPSNRTRWTALAEYPASGQS